LIEDKFASATINKTLIVLGMILSTTVADRELSFNPCDHVRKMPSRSSSVDADSGEVTERCAMTREMQARLDQMPQVSRIRRQTIEHVFGTLKAWMGATHFLTKTLPRVSTEMSLHVLAYNLKRAMQIVGGSYRMQAMRA